MKRFGWEIVRDWIASRRSTKQRPALQRGFWSDQSDREAMDNWMRDRYDR